MSRAFVWLCSHTLHNICCCDSQFSNQFNNCCAGQINARLVFWVADQHTLHDWFILCLINTCLATKVYQCMPGISNWFYSVTVFLSHYTLQLAYTGSLCRQYALYYFCNTLGVPPIRQPLLSGRCWYLPWLGGLCVVLNNMTGLWVNQSRLSFSPVHKLLCLPVEGVSNPLCLCLWSNRHTSIEYQFIFTVFHL